MLAKALLLLGFASADLLAYVSWDGYIFKIECGTATLKYGADYLFICDRSEVKVIGNHLIVENYGGEHVDIAISAGTAAAIGNEFYRDSQQRRKWIDDRQPPRPDPRPEKPVERKPKSISLPAAQSF